MTNTYGSADKTENGTATAGGKAASTGTATLKGSKKNGTTTASGKGAKGTATLPVAPLSSASASTTSTDADPAVAALEAAGVDGEALSIIESLTGVLARGLEARKGKKNGTATAVGNAATTGTADKAAKKAAKAAAKASKSVSLIDLFPYPWTQSV